MGDSVVSDSVLEVSVSFGRFDNDSLSWDKWSAFSQNKYLEEVGKCSTPGSVAKKKAYFEAHYKKIAARKAELIEEEKQIEVSNLRSDESNGAKFDENKQMGSDNFELNESNSGDLSRDSGGDDEKSDVFKEEVECETEVCERLSVDAAKEEVDGRLVNLKLSIMEDEEKGVLVKDESIYMGSKDIEEERAPKLEDEIGNLTQNLAENVKLDQQNESKRIAPANKEKNLTQTKKKLISSAPKSPQISAPNVSKQASNSTPISSTRSLAKKGNASTSSKAKHSPVVDSKRRVPTSLHMSLSLGPTNSDQNSLTTSRRSLIMESMGDKDIVKRAFKSFQNNLNQLKSSSEGRSASKEVLMSGTEQKVSTSVTPRKENEGRKATEKLIAQRGQTKPRGSAMPSRSFIDRGLDQRSAKPAPSSLNLRKDDKTEKRKEFLKKLEEKSNAREAERTHVRSQPKQGEKDIVLKKLRQSLNFKATPMPSFYRVQGLSKGRLDKGGVKSENN